MNDETHGDRYHVRRWPTDTHEISGQEPRWHDLNFRVRGAIIASGIAFVTIVGTVAFLVLKTING